MKNVSRLAKLNQIASKEPSSWIKNARERQANQIWLHKSAKIAAKILRTIREQKETRGMTQNLLAKKVEVSPQYISKVVKGKENLSLETICKLEKALGIVLVDVPPFKAWTMVVNIEYGKASQVVRNEAIPLISNNYLNNQNVRHTHLSDCECKYGLISNE